MIGGNTAVTSISALRIFDRWGNLVHEYSGNIENYEGWDGTYNNKDVEIGVYTYSIIIGLANDESINQAGTLTLLR